jgi:hypothetical protein
MQNKTPEMTNTPTTNPDDAIYVSARCVNEKFSQFIVKSTDREIKGMIQSCDDDGDVDARMLFISTARELNKYSVDELIAHHDANFQEYQDWNNDVALFATAKFVLFGVPIELIRSP